MRRSGNIKWRCESWRSGDIGIEWFSVCSRGLTLIEMQEYRELL
jgi:hypothetical protein